MRVLVNSCVGEVDTIEIIERRQSFAAKVWEKGKRREEKMENEGEEEEKKRNGEGRVGLRDGRNGIGGEESIVVLEGKDDLEEEGTDRVGKEAGMNDKPITR